MKRNKPKPQEFYDSLQLMRYYEEVKELPARSVNLLKCFNLDKTEQTVLVMCEQHADEDLSEFRKWLLEEFGEFIYVII